MKDVKASASAVKYLLTLLAAGLFAGCASANQVEERPFFQHEYELENHGPKTLFDRIVQLNPGGFDIDVTPAFMRNPPARIAVLPRRRQRQLRGRQDSADLPHQRAALQLVVDRAGTIAQGDAGLPCAA
jgi:hypothetical protein